MFLPIYVVRMWLLSRSLLRRSARLPAALQKPEQLFSKYKFADFDLHDNLRAGLTGMSIETVTSIQAKSFVPISSYRDTTLCSETGSGKTLAYLIPLLNRTMFRQEAEVAPQRFDLLGRFAPPTIVLCPTVELCMQVLSVAQSLDPANLVSKQVLNSVAADTFVSPRIRWGAVDLVLATPAKFAQDLERFRQDKLVPGTIVFDEADLLFHGSAQAQVLDIIEYLRPRVFGKGNTESPKWPCQFVFASATVPHIGHFTLGSMLTQRFGTAETVQTDRFHTLPSSIEAVDWVSEPKGDWDERCYMLSQTLHSLKGQRVLVFVNSVGNCNALYTFLREKKWPVNRFFRTSRNAQDVASLFSDGVSIVVATDVAARGIDWEDVDTVINFQMPTDVVSWIHRAGRCGRLGRRGRVISFFKEKEEPLVEALKRKLAIGDRVDSLFSHKRSLKKRLSS